MLHHALAYRDDDDEHERGAVGVPELLGLLGLSAGRLPLAAVEQSLPLPLRLLHRPEEQDVEHDEHRARHQVHEQHAEPEEGARRDSLGQLGQLGREGGHTAFKCHMSVKKLKNTRKRTWD